jgi:acetoacetate decarboxylase
MLLDRKRVRPLVPEAVCILPVLPGKTLGLLMWVHYGLGSTLNYNELIFLPALVIYRGRIGMWVSHIYVDDEQSYLGGRQMFGVPKELARFEWPSARMGTARMFLGNQEVIRADFSQPSWSLPLPVLLGAFGNATGQVRWFSGVGWARGGIGKVEVRDSALDFPFQRPFLNLVFPMVKASLGRIHVLTS